jgi:flagellar protein FlaH
MVQEDSAALLGDDEEEEELEKVIAVGVMDMDKRLGGGLPIETITLVEGDPDAGKSALLTQLVHGALNEGYSIAAFLSETTPREFLEQMDSLGMPSIDYYLVRRLSLFHVNLRVDREKSQNLMDRLIKYMKECDDRDVFVVDSITPIIFQFDARYVLNFLATCKEIVESGRTIMVALHSYAINESVRLRASSIVDAHLRLRIEELGEQIVRTLEVAKVRGAVKTVGNTVSFTVEAGIGLKSVPISKTKA